MRKFKFTLATLLKIKEAQEKQKKLELAEAERLLRLAQEELEALYTAFETKRAEYNEKLKTGADVNDLQAYSRYFTYLRERTELQKVKVKQAEAEKLKRQAALIEAMTEVKALNKLKEAQYEEYLQELKIEQEKEIGDFVSFNVISG